MEKDQYKRIYQFMFIFSFVLLFFLQRFYFGIRYFPVIDDWFLHLGNSVIPDQWNNVILANGLLGLRPFACMVDSYLIGPFADHIVIPYLVILLMLAAAMILMWKTFSKRGVYAGAFLMAFMAMCPVNAEATYWMSASSRICTVLFFIALNGFLLMQYLTSRKKWYLVFNIITGIFCVGFYETAIPVYVLYQAVILFYHKEDVKKNLKFLLIPFVLCAGIALYYIINSSGGEVANRGSLVSENYLEHFSYVSREIGHVFFDLFPRIIKEGLVHGIEILRAGSKGILYTAVFLILSAAFGFSYMKLLQGREIHKVCVVRTAVCGVLFIIAGLIVNYPLAYVRISLRVVFFAGIGIGILADLLFVLISQYKIGRYVTGVAVAVMAFVCSIAWVGENDFYRMTNALDNQIADQLIEGENKEKILDAEYDVLLCGAPEFYFDDIVQHFEHIHSASSMYAAITGAVRYKMGIPDIANILVYPEWVECSLYVTPEIMQSSCVFYVNSDYSIAKGTLEFEGDNIRVVGEEGIPVGLFQYIGESLYAYERMDTE